MSLFQVHPKECEFTIKQKDDVDIKLDRPRDIAMTKDKIFLIGNLDSLMLWVYDRTSFDLLFTIDGPFGRLFSLALDSDEQIYVSNVQNIIKIFLSQDCKRITSVIWHREGASTVHLKFPFGLMVNKQLLYVCDSDNCRIVVFDLDLNPLYEIGGELVVPIGSNIEKQFLFSPNCITYDGTRYFYITNKITNIITKLVVDFENKTYEVIQLPAQKKRMRCLVTFNNDMVVTCDDDNAILLLGEDGEIKDEAKFDHPKGLAVFEGNFYVSDEKFIKRFQIQKNKIEIIA